MTACWEVLHWELLLKCSFPTGFAPILQEFNLPFVEEKIICAGTRSFAKVVELEIYWFFPIHYHCYPAVDGCGSVWHDLFLINVYHVIQLPILFQLFTNGLFSRKTSYDDMSITLQFFSQFSAFSCLVLKNFQRWVLVVLRWLQLSLVLQTLQISSMNFSRASQFENTQLT